MINSSLCFRRGRVAFTLIELLVVISIIAVLAGLLLPAVLTAQTTAKSKKAQMEISQFMQAIHSYYSIYSRYPVSTNAMYAATQNQRDFTYGTYLVPVQGITPIGNAYALNGYEANNSEVVAILLDMETLPFTNVPTVNFGHIKNPQGIKFDLGAKMSNDLKLPGVGPDLVYRDPWGNPYIVSLDLNYDDKCWDAVYRRAGISQRAPGNPSGYNGLFNATDTPGGNGDNYAFNGGVMIWSLGPDSKYISSSPANAEPNRDNVVSWK